MRSLRFDQVIERLQAHYGRPAPPKIRDPWHLVLWENVAYLADDARRSKAFQTLKKEIGTTPREILSASLAALMAVTGHGILAERFAAKLRRCAEIAAADWSGGLRQVLKLPLPQAKRALQKFPGIGEPAAEKILLFARAVPILALDSNGVRVLLRLGFEAEKKSYAATYRALKRTVSDEKNRDCAQLIRSYQLLRRHGQELCRRSQPLCEQCPLASLCAYFRKQPKSA